jgi:hypothetical protein
VARGKCVSSRRDRILESYAALAPEALGALSPQERRKVYGILNLTVEPLADGALQISGAFGEETSVWEDVRTSRRSFSDANPAPLGFTLIVRDGRLETVFELVHNARGSLPR